jgi:gliding motility-associated-like protein
VKVLLAVANSFGCTDTTTKTVFIEPFYSFYLPTAFSPNNDGLNDEFLGRGYYNSLTGFSLKIYNRWGELLFQTTSPTEGWNGQKNNAGEPLPEGIYLSVLRYKSYTGQEIVENNYVHLTR